GPVEIYYLQSADAKG
nr:RecName: Full=40 kDa cell wall protein [Solanum lycopersicum]